MHCCVLVYIRCRLLVSSRKLNNRLTINYSTLSDWTVDTHIYVGSRAGGGEEGGGGGVSVADV